MVETQAIGPWDGGLNLSSSRDLSPYLKKNELGQALNVQMTPEGFIEARPGFKTLDVTLNTGSPEITILGTINIVNEYITVVQTRTTNTKIYYVRGNKTTVLKATFALAVNFTSVLAMRNSETTPVGDTVPRGVFLFSGAIANGCYRLEEVPNVTATATPVLMAAANSIPRSDFSFLVKDRVFLIDKISSTIYWSATFEFSLYFNQNEVTPEGKATGDAKLEPSVDQSDNITSVQFVNNNFYLFKKSSSFIFTYQADPEADGYLRKFNDVLGAFDSTLFRNTVVVVNNRGIFTVEATDFIDIQQKLNLRFETPLDNRSSGSGFISNMNNMVIVGFKASDTDKEYHYIINGVNRAWAQWDFTYADPEVIASPGTGGYFTQDPTGLGIILFTTFDKTRLIYTDWKPLSTIYDYQLDGNTETDTVNGNHIRYIPKVEVQTQTMVGNSILDYKKLLRSYVRLYISDLPYSITNAYWKFSINYNDFYFKETNPEYLLAVDNADWTGPDPGALVPVETSTVIYKRTYQIPIPMHRVKEFTFQLRRDFTKLIDILPLNGTPDRVSEAGYYFLLSGLWTDYVEKKRL